MHVKTIKLINFRNYKNLDIELNDKLNVFLGDNAQGKTNLLESIYICSTGKSYRTSKDKELINLYKDKAYIGLKIEKDNNTKTIEIKFDKDKPKRVKINRVELDKISEIMGTLNVVIFSPEDLRLVKDGPSERRAFLDNEISQIKPKYRYNINRYNKILQQRNNLLKRIQLERNKIKVLEVWDVQLANIGSEIIKTRIDFLKKLKGISKEIHKMITGEKEELNIKYLPTFNIDVKWDIRDINLAFLNELKKRLENDIEKGTTCIGPHRDDISLIIDGLDCRIFGSQGQQRTAALSLKLAEVELIRDEVGEYPVLLLDDVLSELDYSRRNFLLSTFKDIQTIITSTDDIKLDNMEKVKKSLFYIRQGTVEKIKKTVNC